MRKIYITAIAAMFILVLVSASVFYNNTFAQSDDGRLAHIYEGTEEGDKDVIARIGDQTVIRQELRRSVEYIVANEEQDPTAKDAAVEEMKAVAQDYAIVALVHSLIEHAEAVDRGFTVTDAEVEAFMAPIKEMCASPADGTYCQRLIRAIRLPADEYWELAFDEYKKLMVRMKMKTAHINALYPDGFSFEQRNEAMEAFETRLYEDATIQWEDDELREVYENASSGSTGNVND